jgi:uncharacterized membrane protein YdjX (TVP38/TMEM64 family)
MKNLKRFIPLIIIAVIIIAAIKFNIMHYLNFASLQQHHAQLALYVQNHYFLSISVFCICYIVLVTASIPGASIFSLLAGFLFGSIIGTSLVVTSATIGATLLVIAVKLAFGESVAAKIGSKVKFMETNFKQNAFYYLLSLRFLPILPFWLINLAAGIFNIKLRDFILATFLGIIPGTFVYVNIGSSLTSVFAQNSSEFKLSSLISPQILLALTLLGIISFIPVIVKSLKKGKTRG